MKDNGVVNLLLGLVVLYFIGVIFGVVPPPGFLGGGDSGEVTYTYEEPVAPVAPTPTLPAFDPQPNAGEEVIGETVIEFVPVEVIVVATPTPMPRYGAVAPAQVEHNPQTDSVYEPNQAEQSERICGLNVPLDECAEGPK